jgi:hypothetical protein
VRVTAPAWKHEREVRDALPDAPRETSVLVAAAGAALAQMLLDHVGQGMDAAPACSLTA